MFSIILYMTIAYIILLDDYVFSNISYDYIMSFCYMTMSAILLYMTICYVILLHDYMFSILSYMTMFYVILLDNYVFFNILFDYVLCQFAR